MLVAPGHARAQSDEEAKRLFDQGLANVKANRFADAALAFEAAYRARPHAASLFMAGGAWEEAGSLVRAADAWAACLSSPGLNSAQKQRAEQRLSELEVKVATLIVRSRDTHVGESWAVRLGDGSFFALPARLHAVTGNHRIEVRDGNGKTHLALGIDVSLRSGVGLVVPLDLTPREPSVQASVAISDAKESAAPVPESKTPTAQLVAAAGLVTLGAASLVASSVMWSRANKTHDAFDATPTWELHDKGVSQVRWTNALGIGGSVLLLSGVAVWLWPNASVQPQLSVNSVGIVGVF
jgi:hypothetical protein